MSTTIPETFRPTATKPTASEPSAVGAAADGYVTAGLHSQPGDGRGNERFSQ